MIKYCELKKKLCSSAFFNIDVLNLKFKDWKYLYWKKLLVEIKYVSRLIIWWDKITQLIILFSGVIIKKKQKKNRVYSN